MSSTNRPEYRARAIAADNASGAAIPPRSFVKIQISGGTVQMVKPDADDIPAAQLAVTGPAEIPATATGAMVTPADGGKIWVDYSGDTPSAGDDFGCVSGQWYGTTDQTGFKACGAAWECALVGPFSAPGVDDLQVTDDRSRVTDGSTISGGYKLGDWVAFDSPKTLAAGNYAVAIRRSDYGTVATNDYNCNGEVKQVTRLFLQLQYSDTSITSIGMSGIKPGLITSTNWGPGGPSDYVRGRPQLASCLITLEAKSITHFRAVSEHYFAGNVRIRDVRIGEDSAVSTFHFVGI